MSELRSIPLARAREGSAPDERSPDERLVRDEQGAEGSQPVEPRFLVFVSGKRPGGTVYMLRSDRTTIGSDETADIRIPDRSIAPVHAVVAASNGSLYVEVLVSGPQEQRRTTQVRVGDGDTVRLGAVQLTFLQQKREPRPPEDPWMIAIQSAKSRIDTGDVGDVEVTMPIDRQAVQRRRPFGLDLDPITAQMSPPHQVRHPHEQPQRQLPRPPAAAPARRSDDDDEKGLSLLEIAQKLLALWAFLRAHRRLLGIACAAGLFAGLMSAVTMPPVVTAVAAVSLHPEVKADPVDQRRQEAVDPTTQFFFDVTRNFTNRELVKATLKAFPGAAIDEETIRRTTARLKIDNTGPNEYAVAFSPRADEPGSADPAGFLDTHMKTYLSTEVSKRLKVMVAEVEFLRQQMSQLDAELQSVSSRAVAFKEKNVDRLPEHSAMTPEARGMLEARRVELTGQVHRLEGELDSLRKRIGRGAPLAHAKAQSTQIHRDRLATIQQQLGEARAQGLADGHPEVRKLMEQKAATERLIATQMTSETSTLDRLANVDYDNLASTRDQVESSLRAAQAELRSVRGSLDNFDRISRDMPRVGARVGELAQTEEGLRRLRAQLFDRVKRAELQLELERVSARSRYEIVDPVHLEQVRLKRVLALRGVLGVVAGLAIAFGFLAFLGARSLFQRAQATTAATAAALVMLVALGSGGCAGTPRTFAWAKDVPGAAPAAAPILRGDTLFVEVKDQPTMGGEVVVREDGRYVHAGIGPIEVAGVSPAQAAQAIMGRLQGLIVNPRVIVTVLRSRPARVAVVGEVRTPGAYELDRDRRVVTALAAAGWLTEFAHDDAVYVVRREGSGPAVRFRVRELTSQEPAAQAFLLGDGDTVVVE